MISVSGQMTVKFEGNLSIWFGPRPLLGDKRI
jgi:hypothetical protein